MKEEKEAIGRRNQVAGLTDFGKGGRMRPVDESQVDILCRIVTEADKPEVKISWNL